MKVGSLRWRAGRRRARLRSCRDRPRRPGVAAGYEHAASAVDLKPDGGAAGPAGDHDVACARPQIPSEDRARRDGADEERRTLAGRDPFGLETGWQGDHVRERLRDRRHGEEQRDDHQSEHLAGRVHGGLLLSSNTRCPIYEPPKRRDSPEPERIHQAAPSRIFTILYATGSLGTSVASEESCRWMSSRRSTWRVAAVLVTVAFHAGPPAVRSSLASAALVPGARQPALITVEVGSFPNAVAFGAGSAWVAAQRWNTTEGVIVRLDPTNGEEQARIPLESPPTWEVGGAGMAFGEGNLWVTGGGSDGTVLTRIDATTNEISE